MPRPGLELADIFRQHGPAYRQAHDLPCYQQRLMWAIENCRTPALGGVVEWCDHCQYTHIQYRSCRNRHCPKCQELARARWLQQRQAELLPVEYFHVVFTIPQAIAAIAFYNKEVVYEILFRTAAQTLLTLAADPQRLGVEIGWFAILHSWGQNLHFHPHLHCVVPGGGLVRQPERWIHARRRFLLPVKVLSARFRRRFLKALQNAYRAGKLKFFAALAGLSDAAAFTRYLAPLKNSKWVVYAKAPLGGPHQVLEYLGRYTHRVAISNRRLVALEEGQVTFEWKDYRDAQRKRMTVSAEEFIRRFLLHSLPPGFQRIRYYGWMANAHRAARLKLCRRLLATPAADLLPRASDYRDFYLQLTGINPRLCPRCGAPLIRLLLPRPLPPQAAASRGGYLMSFHAAIADSRAAVTAGPALTLSSGDWLRLYLLSHPLAAPVPCPIRSRPVRPCLPQHPAGDHPNVHHYSAAITHRTRRTEQNPLQPEPLAAV